MKEKLIHDYLPKLNIYLLKFFLKNEVFLHKQLLENEAFFHINIPPVISSCFPFTSRTLPPQSRTRRLRVFPTGA